MRKELVQVLLYTLLCGVMLTPVVVVPLAFAMMSEVAPGYGPPVWVYYPFLGPAILLNGLPLLLRYTLNCLLYAIIARVVVNVVRRIRVRRLQQPGRPEQLPPA